MLSLILSGLIILSSIALVILFFKARADHEELVLSVNENSQRLAQRVQKLKKLGQQLTEHPNRLDRGEREHVMNEINKVSKLWKSRRERLREGLWERMEREPAIEEKIEEPRDEDELSILNHKKERINNLMKKTKIEYRKRKLDEVSFREIMRDYQKELMEIDVRISELER